MITFTIPKVDLYPTQGANEFPTVIAVDFFLTILLQNTSASCTLRARDEGEESIVWRINEQTIATTPRPVFRSLLARFGSYYMTGQLYAGYTIAELLQENRKQICHFYLGNSSDTGFWIEIYARKA